MAILSGGGGDDRLQVQLAIFGIIISLMVTALLPVLVGGGGTGYTIEEIYEERSNLELYTGESMISQAPFQLQHVYLPYTIGEEYRLTEEGWLYGSELTDGDNNPSYTLEGTEYIGQTEIRLDPTKKSNVPLYDTQTIYTKIVYKSTLDFLGGGFWQSVAEGFLGWMESTRSASISYIEQYEQPVKDAYPTWNYSGYRYELDPMLRINTENGTSTKVVDDAKLSIVWYDLDGQEGISGGLVLYNNKTNAILASYTAAEIVAQYHSLSQTASKFRLNFDGTLVNMWIRFDPDVLINNLDLSQSFSQGRWTVAFTCASADLYLDIQNSQSFTASLGSMLQTYIDIFTMDVPDVGAEWNLVLWIVCVMPMGLAMILFLSRFGLAGVGAGILGAIFAGGVL